MTPGQTTGPTVSDPIIDLCGVTKTYRLGDVDVGPFDGPTSPIGSPYW